MPLAQERGPSGASAEAGPVLVLGGTGFLGRHVCAAFADAGREVLAVNRRPPRPGFPHRSLSLDVSTAPADLLVDVVRALRPGVVVNAAGGAWTTAESEMISGNIVVTERIVQAITLASHPVRLIQLGSVLEYGPVPYGESVGERTGARPQSAYGRTKLAATQAVLAAAATGRVNGLVLRLTSVAGPGLPPVSLLGRVAEQLLDASRQGREAVIELSPLRAQRDYVDFRDAADAVVAAADRRAATGRAIAVGSGAAVPVRALVNLLIQVSGIPTRIVESELARPARSRERAEVDWLQVDPGAAAETLGWRPRRSLEDSVRALWADVAVPRPQVTAGS